MSENKIWTREFVGMGLTNFFYFMSQYILIAALPVFIMDDLGKGQWEAGMAMTCFQIGTVLCRPLAGRIIDGVNKQKLLLGSSLVFFLLMAGFYFASSLQAVWLLRLVHGAVFALGTTASAAMAALVLPRRRKGEGIGYLRCAAIWPWSSGRWWASLLWIIWVPIPSLSSCHFWP